ncbi:hypothetical protein SAY87_017666 [Trapa incisa]|uniref:DUF3741 domain-containing protein n=1 Tax=Trapa incisa TaxID=236973 RepID=A0AAN7L4R3_9MYRT|nr:hypothetical protein SAY87_017666 [Trapa incisa]
MVSSSSSNGGGASAAEANLHGKNSIGCMWSIIQLVCKYPNRRKFFITSGKKSEKTITVSSSSPSNITSLQSPTENSSSTGSSVVYLTADEQPVYSSPTTSPLAEIHRSSSLNSPESFHSYTTPAPLPLVARLMGLSTEPFIAPSETEAEKRQKLLSVMEKCDNDLKALKKIINTVCSISVFDSPVSGRYPSLARCMKQRQPDGRLQQQQQPSATTNGADEVYGNWASSCQGSCHHPKKVMGMGMKETVEEVCRDFEWGERREVGRIGLAMQDHICRDLVEEAVKDMGLPCNYQAPAIPPFEACKRRLCF